MELTDEQANIMHWIERYSRVHGFPPCRRDIERKFDIGGYLVQRRLGELQEAGYIQLYPGLARGIRILRHLQEAVKV